MEMAVTRVAARPWGRRRSPAMFAGTAPGGGHMMPDVGHPTRTTQLPDMVGLLTQLSLSML